MNKSAQLQSSCQRRLCVVQKPRLQRCCVVLALRKKIIVVGGGAAGLAAAWHASSSKTQVTVLESQKKVGQKILLSGGTRCNLLPSVVDIGTDYFTESNFDVLQHIFNTWDIQRCFQWLNQDVNIPMSFESSTSKWFPEDNDAHTVRNMLQASCQKQGVIIKPGCAVQELRRKGKHWQCVMSNGKVMTADKVILASGGLSYPKVGTNGAGFRIVEQLGLDINQPYPALVPLCTDHPGNEKLSGTSLQSVVVNLMKRDQHSSSKEKKNIKGQEYQYYMNPNTDRPVYSQRHGFLFTHKGMSGPSILDMSHFAIMDRERGGQGSNLAPNEVQNQSKKKCQEQSKQSGDSLGSDQGVNEWENISNKSQLQLQWTELGPEEWAETLSRSTPGQCKNRMIERGIPKRLVSALLEEANLSSQPRKQLKPHEVEKIVNLLCRYPLKVTRSEGYKKAEVTGGGIRLEDLSQDTMEIKELPGLYTCGELVDVHGRIGGFNFYWAWVSGRLAGIGAAGGQSIQEINALELSNQVPVGSVGEQEYWRVPMRTAGGQAQQQQRNKV